VPKPPLPILFCIGLLAGCSAAHAETVALPGGLRWEAHPLEGAPGLEPLAFRPTDGTETEILDLHRGERGDAFPDASFFRDFRYGMRAAGDDPDLEALEAYTDHPTDAGVFQTVEVQLFREGRLIYSVAAGAGSPVQALRGLWTYSGHWVLEIAYVTEERAGRNEIADRPAGRLIQDGTDLNDARGFDEAFGFQLLHGEPFYFFSRRGAVGLAYAGRETILPYDLIPHDQCCSGSALNPKAARNMVAFFAQKGGRWFYVEAGVFPPA
jgi:hypothetical protein